MSQPFLAFLADFRAAITGGDQTFLAKVYQPWVDTSGMVPAEYLDTWPTLILEQVAPLVAAPPRDTETFDDYGIASWVDPDDPDCTTSMTFQETTDGWIMFNARSNFTAFAKVYTLWYTITGGKVALRINGRRSPLVSEQDHDSAFATISPINASLRPGVNEITVARLSGSPTVHLRISSAVEGAIVDSGEGDVLSWEGTVTGTQVLSIEAR